MKLFQEKKKLLISLEGTGSVVTAVSCLFLANYVEK